MDGARMGCWRVMVGRNCPPLSFGEREGADGDALGAGESCWVVTMFGEWVLTNPPCSFGEREGGGKAMVGAVGGKEPLVLY